MAQVALPDGSLFVFTKGSGPNYTLTVSNGGTRTTVSGVTKEMATMIGKAVFSETNQVERDFLKGATAGEFHHPGPVPGPEETKVAKTKPKAG